MFYVFPACGDETERFYRESGNSQPVAQQCRPNGASRAFAYIPVSIAISIEVMGPLAAALLTSRQRSDLIWVGLSVLGMVLLAGGDIHGQIDLRGDAW
jgi:hypothetical protein